MHTYNFTYTRCTPHGTILEHTADTISAHTVRSAKHALVKRFGLQNWSPWRQTANGFVKTRTTHDERGKMVVSSQLPVASNQFQ
ncbi:hypothetical protein C6499_22620 [Candidatus Poribacteria bacterium]|nr:MAG: hypothetical protein C6499_22620 [Candidatus Poribacteria bacterium]